MTPVIHQTPLNATLFGLSKHHDPAKTYGQEIIAQRQRDDGTITEAEYRDLHSEIDDAGHYLENEKAKLESTPAPWWLKVLPFVFLAGLAFFFLGGPGWLAACRKSGWM